MIKLELTCKYCDHKFVKLTYNPETIKTERCQKCGDTNLEVRDLDQTKIDTYAGSPPFPEKKANPEYDKYANRDDEWGY